ncbi:F0F1 ATP synthase subunit gamma [Granulicella aggregans]|uniref:F0F1 ATP synthase subunit gamma n=1 Tax=Granulicella aggregans TaxID=474949 RepID=UPI0021DF71B5|nr:F0F1 ATP synthase subunit gamma [Granulicella aggregans]
MSGSTEQLGRKINGARNLGGVVRAMKALAASSIGQYERADEALDDYLKTIELGMIACLHGEAQNPSAGEIKPRRAQQIGAVIFGSDQGLVGSFNEVIVEFSLQSLRALPGKVTQIWAVGERLKALLADSTQSPIKEMEVPGSLDAITPLVGQILLEIQSARERGEVWEIQVFHNHPKLSSSYEPVSKRLLPLDESWQKTLRATPWPTKIPPQVIDDIPSALTAFIQDYLFVLLFQACAESLASENASRLASMQRAEKNIDGMLDDLNRKFHRLRQEGIDEELFDVIAGFEALTKKKSKRSG